jgi:hypothetical protein
MSKDAGIKSSVVRRAGVAVALAVGAASSLAVTAPAQAATLQCGSWKTVRVSIRYQACIKLSRLGYVKGYANVQNNHGSLVDLGFGEAISYNLGPLELVATGTKKGVSTGTTLYYQGEYHCPAISSKARFVFKGKQNDGSWGDYSYSPNIRCAEEA